MTCRRVLVLGGARSGKSRYAQELAESCGRPPVYVATAQAWDDEMQVRIERHRAERDARWRTIEAPHDLPGVLERAVGHENIVLVDCLTLWLSNVLLDDGDLSLATKLLADVVTKAAGRVILVSNEVGGGIVPDNALGRRFRDEQGRLNQMMAGICDAVVLVTAGLPQQLKPSSMPQFPGWKQTD